MNYIIFFQSREIYSLVRRNSIHVHACDIQQGCFECVTKVPVFFPDELEIGNHVVFKGEIHDHRGIITDKHIDINSK